MDPLLPIRQQLASLRLRRRLTRWGTAYAALAATLLGILAGLFLLDIALELSKGQRLAMIVLGGALLVWSCRRFTLPLLGVRETETSLALHVERQHGIDSDLVAALQFEHPQAAKWGSRDLQSAVVTQIVQRIPQLDVFRGLRYDDLQRRTKLLIATVTIVLALAALYPRHIPAFFERLFLSSRHYPSDTILRTVFANGNVTLQGGATTQPRVTTCAQGHSVRFVVEVAGTLPEQGAVVCRSLTHESNRSLALRQMTSDERLELLRARAVDTATRNEPQQTNAKDPRIVPDAELHRAITDQSKTLYLAELPQLVEDCEYSIRLGDAWTDPGQIRMIALPAVEVRGEVHPPAYAQSSKGEPSATRHIAVLEGSRVELSVRSLNKKALQVATIRFSQGGTSSKYSLSKRDEEGFAWSLDSATTPLARVTKELRYEIQVVDLDGLGLEAPLQGFIQLTPDRPPLAFAQVVHDVVLPAARPVIEYRVNDDFGIASIKLQTQIERQPLSSDSEEPLAPTTNQMDIPLNFPPLRGSMLPYKSRVELDLTPMNLQKGDQLKVTLEVVDFRGEDQGVSYLTEPIVLQISDEAGVLAAITEADERTEKRLNDTIEKQLGVGAIDEK